jgi:hypothetical protein
MEKFSRNIRFTLAATAAILLLFSESAFCQVPPGLYYQAIVRGSDGKEIVNTTIKIRLSILSDTNGFYASGTGTYIWEEEQSTKTNGFGLINVVFGDLVKAVKVQGSATSFASIPWNTTVPLFMGIKIANPTTFKNMGTSRIWTVPFAMASGNVNGSVPKLAITGTTTDMQEALFEIKNKNGQTVFAVYNEGIRAYVDNGAKAGAKGGFAVGGFGEAKAPSQPLLIISPDSARIYFDETKVKGVKGGFAIGGFDAAKGTLNELMFLTPENYFIGHSSGKLITTAAMYNSTLGYQSGKSLINATNNVFIGYQSGYSTTSGSSNIFMGTSSGYSNTTGYWNIMLGRATGQKNTTGYANIIIGDYAGNNNTTGIRNVFVGDYAGGWNTIGENNVFIGANAGNKNSEGNFNISIGTQAGELNTTGQWNTILGYFAGNANLTSGSQVLLGYYAGKTNTGGWNTMVGSLAGEQSGTANESTYIGLAAGQYATGNRNVFIGRWAGRNEAANSNKLVIETAYEGTDNLNNALVYGDFISKFFKINGQARSSLSKQYDWAATFTNSYGSGGYGIKIQAGDASASGDMIDFYSQAGFYQGSVRMTNGVISLYGKSDARLKENIKDSEINGLKLLQDLKLVDYNYSKSPEKHTGYIAQEAKQVYPEMVAYKEKEDIYTVSYTSLVPILHKAILEQQQQIEAQAKRITELEAAVKLLMNK